MHVSTRSQPAWNIFSVLLLPNLLSFLVWQLPSGIAGALTLPLPPNACELILVHGNIPGDHQERLLRNHGQHGQSLTSGIR